MKKSDVINEAKKLVMQARALGVTPAITGNWVTWPNTLPRELNIALLTIGGDAITEAVRQLQADAATSESHTHPQP